MQDLIQEMYAERLTLDTLSAAIGRQPTYLGRLFRQEEGVTVHEYVTRVRLERAATLIREGVKVEAVALIVGYRSKKNFYIQFKRRFQTTPERYGRQYRVAPAETAPIAVEAETNTAGAPTTVPGMSRDTRGDRRLIQKIQMAVRFGRISQQLAARRFASSTLAMLLTDDIGRYGGANRAAVSLTHYSAAELARLGPNDLFSKLSAVDARCLWQAVLPTSGQLVNAVLRRKDDQSVNVHLVSMPNLLWGRPEMTSMLAECSG
jgi:AraC-like DNA-binding protein